MRLSQTVQNDTQLEPIVINQVSAVMQILVNESVMDDNVSIFSLNDTAVQNFRCLKIILLLWVIGEFPPSACFSCTIH